MPRLRIQPAIDWLTGVITQPRHELDRWEAAARYVHDLGISGARQLQRDRAPQMAGALAFRTLFGLLPVLVMAAVFVRAIKGTDEFRAMIGDLIAAGGLASIGTSENNLSHFLTELVDQAAGYNVAAIGWIGLAVLIYAALSLMVTIENSFNMIYRAPEGRSWLKRFPMYWLVLTVGPVLIGTSLYVNAKVEADIIGSLIGWEWLLGLALALWSFLITWLLLLSVYLLVPNTTIRMRPAMTGALIAAILLSLLQRGLGAYLSNAVSVTQFGGSLGLVPLFMLWVYVMWLVVLFGLEVSAILQMLSGRSLGDIEQKGEWTGLVDPAAILLVMEVIVERFGAATPTTARDVVEATGLAETTVRKMIDRLTEAGLLHRLDRDDEAVSLARPPESIGAEELIDLGFSLVDEGAMGRPAPVVERLREAQRAIAAGTSLRDLLPAPKVAADP